MLTQRCWTILAHSIGVTLLAALLWGMVLLVERHVGDRRKAVGWVFGVYVLGGAIWGATVAHVFLRVRPPALWEPGDSRKVVRWFSFAFVSWPLVILLGLSAPVIDSLVAVWAVGRHETR